MELKITYAAERNGRQYMEDTFFFSKFENGDLLAVFDGHGGGASSDFCEQQAHKYFLENLEKYGKPTDALYETIALLEDNIVNAGFEDGTTASLVYIDKGRKEATVAVIGDSPVIIYNPIKGTWYGPDHNVRTNPTEMNAAINRGGHMYGGYICNNAGVGLQMGRALGDKALGKILNKEPEVFVVDLDIGGYVLVATDGVFDPSHKGTTSLVKAAEYLKGDPSSGAEDLVKRAVEAKTGDNATAILARF